MENKELVNINSKNIILEISLRLNFKDYRLKITTKRAWVISIILLLVRLWVSFADKGSP